jgi:hypothetical protein
MKCYSFLDVLLPAGMPVVTNEGSNASDVAVLNIVVLSFAAPFTPVEGAAVELRDLGQGVTR